MIPKINVSIPLFSALFRGGALKPRGRPVYFPCNPHPLAIPLNLPWPPLTKPLHPQGSQRASCGQMCAPTPSVAGLEFINPLLPTQTAFSPLTNASLDRCSLTHFQGREAIGQFLKWQKIDEVSSCPNSRRWQLGLMTKSSSFSSRHQAVEVTLYHLRVQKFLDPSNTGCIFVSRPHRSNTSSRFLRALTYQPGSIFFCLAFLIYQCITKKKKMLGSEKKKNTWG